MKRTILLAITICLFTAANAQKTKVAPAQKTEKTFIVSAATAKDLPEGVTFINDKISLKSGFKFENLPNSGGVRLVNSKGNLSGTFKCYCLSGGSVACSLRTGSGFISCDGNVCCTLSTTIETSKISNMQMKQN